MKKRKNTASILLSLLLITGVCTVKLLDSNDVVQTMAGTGAKKDNITLCDLAQTLEQKIFEKGDNY